MCPHNLDIPKNPNHDWKEILIAIYMEFGTEEFTSRDVADLLKITIYDASTRLSRFRGWGLLKIVGPPGPNNSKVHVVTDQGRRVIKNLKGEKRQWG